MLKTRRKQKMRSQSNDNLVKKNAGMTLIELMIVVVIMGILASIATPIYYSNVSKSRRSDGQGTLASFAATMNRYHTKNNTFTGAATAGADTGAPSIFPSESPVDSGKKYYDLSIQSATDSTFTLRATPKNAQSDNGILEINSLGIKSWDENDDGDVSDAGEDNWDIN